ncbi:tetratricopeptide repeat protein [Pajaroellobacter abortibovis]|uniref:Uncharacterized protein n=1 Tax=Pajaroellobacter abortibovis TaxID=1882918 RepID=A0A1L6MWJ6_9BACT|nr:tetratricopeptide repeat protein [Pajaroellobacter abortibovis]APR99906.1 hypothetical protein BCY86_03835 [Pajaroellobacter abortibovis]
MELVSFSPLVRMAGVGIVLGMGGVGCFSFMAGLGYEHALVSGLIVPSVAAVVCAFEQRKKEKQGLIVLLQGMGVGAFLANLSFLAGVLHGWRVGFCDLGQDISFFWLTAGLGSLLGGAWGACSGWIGCRWGWGRMICAVVACAAPLASVGVSLCRFYGSPMVFSLDPFFGYFNGALYDIVLGHRVPLLTYRIGTLSTLLGALAFALWHDRREASSRKKWFSHWLLLGMILWGISGAMTWCGPRLGHWQTSHSIAQQLGGLARGNRCHVFYPVGIGIRRAALLVKDCEEQLARVESRLKVRGPDTIQVFFFESAEQKKHLMGAGEILIAKPWRHEVYLQMHSYPHPVLSHELAHVVAASFGRGPFRIAGEWGGWLPNPGLIEGLAVAVSPDEGELTAEQWARVLMDLNRMPSFHSLFSLNFLGSSAVKNYTLSGAFLRWLMMEKGIGTVRDWYSGESIEALTGEAWPALEHQFRTFLKTLKAPPAEAYAYALSAFERPGIFGLTCPHALEVMRQKADQDRHAGRWLAAIHRYDRILSYDSQDERARFGRAMAIYRLKGPQEGVQALQAFASDLRGSQLWRDRAVEALADDAFVQGRYAEAKARYEELATRGFEGGVARTLEIKAMACTDPEIRHALFPALWNKWIDPPPDAWIVASYLTRWMERSKNSLGAYLLARHFFERGWYLEAKNYMDHALEQGLPTVGLEREALRIRVFIACLLGSQEDLKNMCFTIDSKASFFEKGAEAKFTSLYDFLKFCHFSGP